MKFALAGNPNCGKTTLFNSLTGATAHVGNWPGVTVDKREGVYKKLSEKVDIVDLPGIYSLSPYTPEEIVSRNFIIDEHPDCVINVVDATNLERNLYLTTQLLEIDVPMVVALNMMDVVKQSGTTILVSELERKLNVPVVEISALKGEGIKQLMEVAYKATKTKREGFTVVENKALVDLIKETETKFKGKVESPLFHATKLIENDELEVKNHTDILNEVNALKAKVNTEDFDGDFEAVFADERYKFITKNFSKTVVKKDSKEVLSKSDKIDKVLTHRIWSIPIFLVIMFLVFHVVFSADFLGLSTFSGGKAEISNPTAINIFSGMGYEDLVNESVSGFVSDEENKDILWVAEILAKAEDDQEDAIAEVVSDIVENGTVYEGYDVSEVTMALPSPGVFLQSWMGFATGSLIGLFEGFMPAGKWYTGLVIDGVLTGIDAIFSFIPQVLLLFLFISILEDSGYMARVAFIMDRAFRKFGLSGKSFIPLLMGFGCSVPAMIATKTLEDEKERDLTIRLTPFFSCGAKAPIWTMLAVVVGGSLGDIFVFSIYLLGIVVAIVAAIIMKLFSKHKEVPPFIMELPAYHRPQVKNLLAHLWEKFKHFLYKASTIVTASIILIWFLSTYGWAFWQGPVEIENSMLASIGHGLKYIFYPLGWAQDEFGWAYSTATVTGLIAKEDVVTTMAQLGLDEAGMAATGISTAAIYAFAAYNLFTLPCFAAVSTAKSASSKKGFWVTLAWWLGLSYVVSFIVYWFGTLIEVCWPAAIAVALVVIAGIVLCGLFVTGKIGKKKVATK